MELDYAAATWAGAHVRNAGVSERCGGYSSLDLVSAACYLRRRNELAGQGRKRVFQRFLARQAASRDAGATAALCADWRGLTVVGLTSNFPRGYREPSLALQTRIRAGVDFTQARRSSATSASPRVRDFHCVDCLPSPQKAAPRGHAQHGTCVY